MEEEKKKKKSNSLLIVLIVLTIVIAGSIGYVVKLMVDEDRNKPKTIKTSVDKTSVAADYKMSGNGLEKFDLAFLKLENNKENMIYSPISIKYALQMLGEGAGGNSKSQIDSIIGDYQYRKYNNSKNMSFANALFIRDSYKDNIRKEYIEDIKTKYNAEVITDSFNNATAINKWVKDKTLNLIDSVEDDKSIQDLNFELINALAIDMNWINLIQCAADSNQDTNCMFYNVEYKHEKYSDYVPYIEGERYATTEFENGINAKSVQIGASINKYDIVNDLGRDNIKKEIEKEYTEWMKTDSGCVFETDASKFADGFIDELNENYKKMDSSTDFYFDNNNDIKVFAKDLKNYNGTQLQYVGIMPKQVSLSNYINKIDKDSINSVIENLKPIALSSFEDGYVTQIKGTIPLFKFDYNLNLQDDLNKLGITDIFDIEKANLSNLTTKKAEIKTLHKANIEFSNEGIKAAAVTTEGGLGDESCGFEHLYEVPVKIIDLTFNKPYLFLIRDKTTGEVWFIGTVYEPIKNTNNKD